MQTRISVEPGMLLCWCTQRSGHAQETLDVIALLGDALVL